MCFQLINQPGSSMSAELHSNVWCAVLLLPQSQWQAAPAGAAQDEDVDASDSEEAEAAEAATGSSSGAQPEEAQSSEAVLNGALQQLQLRNTPDKMVWTSTHLVPWFTICRDAQLSLCLLHVKRYTWSAG